MRSSTVPTPGLNLTRHQLDTVHIHPDSISRTLTKAALPAKMRIAAGLEAFSPRRPGSISDPHDLRPFTRAWLRHRRHVAERKGCEGREGISDAKFLPSPRTAQPQHRRTDPTAAES